LSLAEWMGADHVPLGSRHCFVYLNERAAQQAQASNLKRSLEVVTIADEFQSQIEGLYDDKEVGEAISLMDHFVAPLVAPLPYGRCFCCFTAPLNKRTFFFVRRETIAKLLDTIFEQDASDELVRQQLYVYLQRVRNVTVGTYVPIANQHSTQSRDYTDWQKLCLMLEACCNKNDAAARHRAKLLLRYCIGVLEDNLVRKRNTPHNAILFAMLNHSSTMPLVKLHQSCLDAFGFAVQQEPRDLQLMETVQRIVHLGYCVYSLTSLGSSVRYGGELAERLISAPKSLSIAFAQVCTKFFMFFITKIYLKIQDGHVNGPTVGRAR